MNMPRLGLIICERHHTGLFLASGAARPLTEAQMRIDAKPAARLRRRKDGASRLIARSTSRPIPGVAYLRRLRQKTGNPIRVREP
jgi:hypothetical protein